ncbi:MULTISPECIES: GNAT family N-acetyltransferase [unclassified Mesorhizobium]|uniref:GNAT family N-acetyltransferase n=1 Tax=unclassified Mesorhizobium TaxID=325217 RepID=UPI001126C8B0|nr:MULTISPECIES: GNAT family N-acetyltransferase [unclassified Mesorhizobium]MCA0025063.1 GNAT family N-acetyltransferase [Mesorhizobium sp. B263B1A]TPJ53790.1 GNAT family N-acetyltransferase [Mesorhizobium sp. B2-6-4]TPJ59507.1 GNAT family N-acetyltransferase [Mesorhizobium sp. B2-6-1]TPJ94106.1 GNAT family N-acetyltransferase [Mesorhizobium sp. B2-5-12]TPK25877.1 GNAT family N-acetyltransferase [Mesorhizobium sp. B2-5-6]
MPEPRPPAPNDIRLRKILDETLVPAHWSDGFVMRTLEPGDAPALHALLTEVFDDGADGPFDEWWPRISGDPEFDSALCFLVIDAKGLLVAAALCWTSAFVRDLAVHPQARGRGIGEALMWHAFAVFRERGADHVDLKTNTVENAAAVRLYQRLGMSPVAWEG